MDIGYSYVLKCTWIVTSLTTEVVDYKDTKLSMKNLAHAIATFPLLRYFEIQLNSNGRTTDEEATLFLEKLSKLKPEIALRFRWVKQNKV